jgi:hypothetical protein
MDFLGYTPVNPSNIVGSAPITVTPSSGIITVGLATSPAFTGVPTAPTAAPGTNTTQLATTAFVQAAAAAGGCTTLGAFPVGIGSSSSQCSTVAGSTAILNGGPLTINPTAASLTQGLLINQSGPTSGSVTGPTSFNLLTASYSSATTGGSQFSDFGNWGKSVAALRVKLTVGGANTAGESLSAITGHVIYTTTPPPAGLNDKIGVLGVAYSNVLDTGAVSALWGAYGAAVLDSGGETTYLIGVGSEADILGTGIVTSRSAFAAANLGTATASGNDSAFSVGSANAGGSFKKMMLLSTSSGASGLQTTGDFFASDGAFTIANIFNLPSATITGNFISTPNILMTGPGLLQMGPQSGPPWNSSNSSVAYPVQAAIASGGVSALTSSTNNTAGFDGLFATNSGNANFFVVGIIESANTSTIFGVTAGGWAEVATVGASNGLLVGTRNNAPMIFGTNNIERMRVLASGGVTVSGGSFGLTGNISAAAWTTNGIRYVNVAATLTDTSSSGTVATVYNDVWGGNTNAASSATTYTNAFGSYFKAPIAGTNVTFTNKYALGADSIFAATSITTPTLYGGSAANSVLALVSTSSGSPSGDKMTFSTGGVVHGTILNSGFAGFGTETNPMSPIVVSLNATTGIAPPIASGVQMQVIAADATGSFLTFQSFGTGVNASFVLSGARGVAATPTATKSGDNLGGYLAQGYGASQYGSVTGSYAGIIFNATQDFTNTSQGIKVTIFTVPNGTNLLALSTTFNASGGVSIGSGVADPGISSLGVGANIFAPNLPTTTAALAAAICWVTSTGQFERDTNAGGCLVSAARFKHGFERLSLAASFFTVMSAQPGSFLYNDNESLGRQVGFRADDFVGVDDRLVGRDANGDVQSFRYMQYTATITAAFQYRVEVEDRRYLELKSDNDNLRADLARLIKAANQ